MNSDPIALIAGVLTIGIPVILIVMVLSVRFINKKKRLGKGERRKSYPALRRILNLMLIVAMVALAAFNCWLFFNPGNGVFSPYFYIVAGFIIIYFPALAGVVLSIRYVNKNTKTRTGEERRQLLWLRRVLNFLIIAPVVGLIVAYIVR